MPEPVPHQLTIAEAAETLRVTPQSIRNWIKSGRIKAARPAREYRVPASEVQRLLAPVDGAR